MKTLIKILCLSVLWFSCEEQNQDIEGCTYNTACNFNENATVDDGSCTYPEINFDCDENCIVDIDCNDVCGGDALLDNCDVCDNDSSNDCEQDECGVWGGNGVDIDQDGICDDIDDCIGEYDDCGVCNGNNQDLDECGNCQGQELQWVELWGECYNIDETTSILLNGTWGNPGELTGSIPPSIGNLTNLTTLNLSYNELTGEIPAEIGNLINLSSLDLGSNQITGEIPSEIGNLTNLIVLNLLDNQLTGEIPTEIGNLINLESLSLQWNNLSEVPFQIENLINLYQLLLNDNQLTSLPNTLCNLPNDCYISVYSNNLCEEYNYDCIGNWNCGGGCSQNQSNCCEVNGIPNWTECP